MKNKKIDFSKYSLNLDKNEQDFFNLIQLRLNNPQTSDRTYNEILNSKKYKADFSKKYNFAEDEDLNINDTFRAMVFNHLGTTIQEIDNKSDSDKDRHIKELFENSANKNKILSYLGIMVDISPILDEDNWLMQKYVQVHNAGYNEVVPITITTGSYYEWQQFSGGHWHNDRQKVEEERIVQAQGEWIFAHGYFTFSEVLAGKADMAELKRKIDKGLAMYYEEAVGNAFTESSVALPEEYKFDGADQEALLKAIRKVEQKTNQKVIIVGEEHALQHMGYTAPINYISDKMADQMNEKGMPEKLLGRDVLPIILPDDSTMHGVLFLLPISVQKFINIVENGSPLVREYTDIQGINARQDMSIGLEIQKKVGVFITKNFIHGEFTISNYDI